MSRDTISNYAKNVIIIAGVVCFGGALFRLNAQVIGLGFLLIILFSTIIAPRMSLALPRSRFIISFSDAGIFLAFLL